MLLQTQCSCLLPAHQLLLERHSRRRAPTVALHATTCRLALLLQQAQRWRRSVLSLHCSSVCPRLRALALPYLSQCRVASSLLLLLVLVLLLLVPLQHNLCWHCWVQTTLTRPAAVILPVMTMALLMNMRR